MKKTLLVPFVTLATSVIVLAVDAPSGATKNLARQHMGANLFQYNPGTQAYSPTQAAAAWLDDDITTGWPAMMGKQYYLLALPEGETVSSFGLSSRPTDGTISLYVGDEPAVPSAKTWTSLATDVAIDSLNEKKSTQTFNHAGKYLLIETNIADPGSIYSLYAYGQKPATSYTIAHRSQPIDVRAIFGPYTNETASFNVAGLYAQASVKAADGTVDYAASAAIDDNPETSYNLPAGTELRVAFGQSQTVARIAMKVDASAKGRFDFFLTDGQTAAETTTEAKPVASLSFEGANSRASVDFAPVVGAVLVAKWTPANAADGVAVYELEAFGNQTLAGNKVIVQGTDVDSRTASNSDGKSDPKAIADGKSDPKGDLPPVGELSGGPYLPGALGFPPNLNARRFRVPPPLNPEPPLPPPLPPSSP